MLAAVLALLGTGCAKDKQEETTSVKVVKNANLLQENVPDFNGYKKSTVDINNDGYPDQVKYFDPETKELRYITRDLNFDHLIDVYEYYKNGELVKDEVDLDYDGKIDLVSEYSDGVATKQHYSINFEGVLSGTYSFDADGNLIRVERDTDGDGKMDTFE